MILGRLSRGIIGIISDTEGINMGIYNAIPEIIELSITVPYKYMDVESVCFDFTRFTNEDYKEVINRFKQEGDISRAYYYMARMVNAYILSIYIHTNNKKCDLQQ